MLGSAMAHRLDVFIKTAIVPSLYYFVDSSCLRRSICNSEPWYAPVSAFDIVRAANTSRHVLGCSTIDGTMVNSITPVSNAYSSFTYTWWKRLPRIPDQQCNEIGRQLWKSEKSWRYDERNWGTCWEDDCICRSSIGGLQIFCSWRPVSNPSPLRIPVQCRKYLHSQLNSFQS